MSASAGGPPPEQYGGGQRAGGAGGAGDFARRNIMTPETKPFFLTSEFLAYVVSVVALAIATAADDDLGSTTLWTLVTVLTFGYMLSRGLSKTGARRGSEGGGY